MAKIRKPTSLTTAEEFAHKVDTIARLEVGHVAILAQQEKSLQLVRDNYAIKINEIENERSRRMGNVLCYATINRAVLVKKGLKSTETSLATWG